MKEYQVFASVYLDVITMKNSQTRDKALETGNVSNLFCVKANSLQEAIVEFSKSSEFDIFMEHHHNANFFYLDDAKEPHRA